jgi:hypothetical protein
VVGDWQLAGVSILQSGPFLTPYQQTVDPANTNILTTVGQARPDQLTGTPLYAAHRTTTQWLNPNAFPYLNLQNAAATALAALAMRRWAGCGPGDRELLHVADEELRDLRREQVPARRGSSERVQPSQLRAAQHAGGFGGFGSITALQTAEGAGPRSLELSARISVTDRWQAQVVVWLLPIEIGDKQSKMLYPAVPIQFLCRRLYGC